MAEEPVCYAEALANTILRNVRYVEDLDVIKPFTDTITRTIIELARKTKAEIELEKGDMR